MLLLLVLLNDIFSEQSLQVAFLKLILTLLYLLQLRSSVLLSRSMIGWQTSRDFLNQ